MKLELVAEDIKDEERLEAALRAQELILAIADILGLLRDRVNSVKNADYDSIVKKCYDVLDSRGIDHLIPTI